MTEPLSPIRIGVIGYGFGQHLVQTLVNMPEYRLVAVADRRSASLDEAADRCGFTACRDAIAMFDDHALDAVCIATSPKSRGPLIEAAMQRDLAMCIEKPWASDRAHAHQLAAMCGASRRPVMVGFSFRFHPAVVRLRAMLDDGTLGRPRMLMGRYCFGWLPPAEHWTWDEANGNGFINENACHLFDVVCHLMGKPRSVFAAAASRAGRPGEDSASITMQFANDAHATLSVGGIAHPAFSDFPAVELIAEHGQARLCGGGHIYRGLRWAVEGDHAAHSIDADPEALGSTRYTDAMRHFAECIRGNDPPSATVDDGVLAVDVAMAVIESARRGKPVCLPQ